MKKMVIGYDAKRAFCNGTGLGNYSRSLIAAAAGSKVMYTPRISIHWDRNVEDAVVRMPQGMWRLAPSLWRTFACAQGVKKDGVQIYHGLSHELPLGLPKDVRKVVTMHDLIVRRYPHYFSLFDRLMHRLKQRHACRVADVVVAISEQTRRDLVDMMHVPEDKIKVVYQSCDAQFWNYAKAPNVGECEAVRAKYDLPACYILCVGTIEERKNQLKVIEACRQLPDDVALVIVGRPRGDYGRRVVAAAGGRIRILQGAAFADFPALYGGAVASVYLSRFEGFGIPVLESMCCDCPVVTSSISSMPEAGGEAALYADPDDAATVAAHLQRLLGDEAFRRTCIEKGRTQRVKFAPEKVAADMTAVYKTLLDN
ncbi:MAG: glycosyltransferase family 4 protein [Bacteroidales bacterium]|nr:glycosyltransferase family 4 protein [Bacteroidales bacterium]